MTIPRYSLKIWKALVTINLSVAACALAQEGPAFKAGGIMSVAWQNSGDDTSPLQSNEGRATFSNNLVLLGEARLDARLSLVAEVQSHRGFNLGLYGLSAVYRVRRSGVLQIEAGKFLAPFGNLIPRRWASENPLAGYPLIYTYLTTASAFHLPKSNAVLLRARGNGHQLAYSEDQTLNKAPAANAPATNHLPTANIGLRVASPELYLTGAQLFGTEQNFFYALAFSNGALSNPVDLSSNSGFNVSARVRYSPFMGLDLGSSFSTAPYLDAHTLDAELKIASKKTTQFRQTVWSGDVAFIRGHLMLFVEAVFNRWESPFISESLDLWGGYVEGRYRFTPRFYLAARGSLLSFAEIADREDIDNDSRLQEPWDYNVRQIELGLGMRLTRNALLKFAYQHSQTLETAGGEPSDDLAVAQAVFYF